MMIMMILVMMIMSAKLTLRDSVRKHLLLMPLMPLGGGDMLQIYAKGIPIMKESVHIKL